jgi:CBS domain containing-hemolysin-like protein
MSLPSSAPSLAPKLANSAKATAAVTFLGLFTVLAVFHAAEIAITTLYPWKVREFAEEEGPKSPFALLDQDITRVLTTILVTSTTCSIYATTVFSKLAASSFSPPFQRYAPALLTLLTLFFVELLPKSVGVSNAELVARKCVAPLMVLGRVVAPLGLLLNFLARKVLGLFGLKPKSISEVSEEELRLIVSGASDSGSIESTEGEMIQGVLNLQDQKVKEIMMPRVEIVAVPKDMR